MKFSVNKLISILTAFFIVSVLVCLTNSSAFALKTSNYLKLANEDQEDVIAKVLSLNSDEEICEITTKDTKCELSSQSNDEISGSLKFKNDELRLEDISIIDYMIDITQDVKIRGYGNNAVGKIHSTKDVEFLSGKFTIGRPQNNDIDALDVGKLLIDDESTVVVGDGNVQALDIELIGGKLDISNGTQKAIRSQSLKVENHGKLSSRVSFNESAPLGSDPSGSASTQTTLTARAASINGDITITDSKASFISEEFGIMCAGNLNINGSSEVDSRGDSSGIKVFGDLNIDLKDIGQITFTSAALDDGGDSAKSKSSVMVKGEINVSKKSYVKDDLLTSKPDSIWSVYQKDDKVATEVSFYAYQKGSVAAFFGSYGIWILILLLLAIIATVCYIFLKPKKALIILDPQNDYGEGGALPQENSKELFDDIELYIKQYAKSYRKIFIARDWHISPGNHFESWAVHCVANTYGAGFPENITKLIADYKVDVISKGQNDEGYSAFEGEDSQNQKIADICKAEKIKQVWIAGIGFDYGILKTTIDAKDIFGAKNVHIIKEMTRHFDVDSAKKAYDLYNNLKVNIHEIKKNS